MIIKRTMLTLLPVVSVLLLVTQGYLFYQAYNRYTSGAQAFVSNQIINSLLGSARQWALERGTTNAALGNASPADNAALARIKSLRNSGDKLLQDALDQLAGSSLLFDTNYHDGIRKAVDAVHSLRQAVDENLAKPKSARTANLSSEWMPGITSLILETQKLRISLGTQSLSLDPSLGKDMMARHSIWLMTEYAGLERGTLAGLISTDETISPGQMQSLLGFRGKVEEGWSMLTNIHFSEEERAIFNAPIKSAQEDFFGSFDKVRQKVYDDARISIGYSMSAQEWIDRATQAIAALEKIQEVSSNYTDRILHAKQKKALRSMVFYSIGLLISVLVAFSAMFITMQLNRVMERVAAEKEREALISRLAQSNDKLERFAYIASHDLQEPLRTVKNFTGLLQKEYSDKPDSKAQKYIEFVSDAATRMQNLISGLLEYSRIESESRAIYEKIDLNKTLDYVTRNLAVRIDETKARINCTTLPVIEGNPVQIASIFQNLIGNALKYQKPGNSPVVDIAWEEKDAEWLFKIGDNGIGIKKEHWEQIFLPFKRLHSKEEYTGSGLGLTICRKTLENLGGCIYVESEPGKGSTFFFTLPKITAIEKNPAASVLVKESSSLSKGHL